MAPYFTQRAGALRTLGMTHVDLKFVRLTMASQVKKARTEGAGGAEDDSVRVEKSVVSKSKGLHVP